MECPRGSSCTESEHEVKTIAKAQEWFEGAQESDLPIKVNQVKAANGRLAISIYSNYGKLIHKRG